VSAQTPLFNPIAVLYERYADVNDEVYRPYLERALPTAGGRAVDLGCGSGRFTGLLADRYEHVLAVDIAEREIDIAASKRARPNITYRAASLLEVTPDRDGLFDAVLSVNTLFNLFGEHDPDDVLRHVRSLIAPGGSAVIVDVVSACSRSALRHRWWGVEDAVRTFARRRSVAAAWTVLRLRQHPVWLRHVRANRALRREAFHERYSAVFPGARFTDELDPFLCGMQWRNTQTKEETS
jgi:2-polyprenyl-3-methyl-5-hydroxy-6-metoxy-1,4-benzoquinol methylase